MTADRDHPGAPDCATLAPPAIAMTLASWRTEVRAPPRWLGSFPAGVGPGLRARDRGDRFSRAVSRKMPTSSAALFL